MRGPGGGRLPRAANPAAREATRIKAATEGTIRRTTRERRVRGARGCRAWDRTRGRSRPRPPASTRVTDASDPSPCRRTPTRWPRRRRKRRAVGIHRRPLHPPAQRTRGIRRRPPLPPRRRRPSTRRVSTAAAAAARRASRRLTSAAPSDALHRVTWQARTLRSVVFEARSAAARETAQPSWVADVDIGSGRACDGCKGTRVRFHARGT
mmetsp:Transcript_10028/g.45945  ORF Transcript_10028/g.45945 Transcript_10028/m.45945 type:complete len:209 (-) Transcript_10028:4-630(-)